MTSRQPRPNIAYIDFAIKRADLLVLVFDYRDDKNELTTRTVSPCYTEGGYLLAFCITRGNYRRFKIRQMANLKFALAVDQVCLPTELFVQ